MHNIYVLSLRQEMSTTNMNDTENLVQVQLEDIIVCMDRETAIEVEGSSSSDAGRSSPADAERSYSAEKSTSLTLNRFAQIKSSVRQNKSVAVVEALKEINKANLEQRQEEFSQMMSLIKRQNEMRHEQILALIKSQDKKRKRGHSDSD
ncbi:hypothetical protein FQA39_LY09463 [Lamprigera yunnana]|nr:hypothetical protein FQA39_LY09463 [Lamprigera yunnana]